MTEIKSADVPSSDLIIDAIYKSINHNNTEGDVISKLFKVSNSGGFRKCGTEKDRVNYVVLYTSGDDKNWIDTIDLTTGIVEYYGDNKKPGKALLDTKKGGNKWLENIFNLLHEGKRNEIPPIFLVQKSKGRDIQFRGLLVPGQIGNKEDLMALWKVQSGKRYQNYKAVFTILDEGVVSRDWLTSLESGDQFINSYTPKSWKEWVEKGKYKPLTSKYVDKVKSKDEQIPNNKNDLSLINTIHQYFEKKPTDFEKMACEIVRIIDKNVVSIDVTQRARDGGRDAVGIYQVGAGHTPVKLTFAVEAKCYNIDNAVGVADFSRLISRIKHREFGFFVTTSYIGRQAYKEFIVEDEHPIAIITAVDIIGALKSEGITTKKILEDWLNINFPISI